MGRKPHRGTSGAHHIDPSPLTTDWGFLNLLPRNAGPARIARIRFFSSDTDYPVRASTSKANLEGRQIQWNQCRAMGEVRGELG
jgi:hypothetical protein